MKRLALLSLISCCGLYAADAHMTTEERTNVLHWLEESHQEFLASIDGVSEEQWKWKPAPERWSVGETAEHIVLAEAIAVRKRKEGHVVARKSRVGRADQGQDRVYREGDGATARQGAGAGADCSQERADAGSGKERFEQQRAEIVKFASDTNLALKEHTVVHPFPVFGTLNAYQWLIYVPLHTERHDKQIAEVKATAGYPK